MSNMTDAIGGAATAYPSGAPEFNPGLWKGRWGMGCRDLVFWEVLVNVLCIFLSFFVFFYQGAVDFYLTYEFSLSLLYFLLIYYSYHVRFYSDV